MPVTRLAAVQDIARAPQPDYNLDPPSRMRTVRTQLPTRPLIRCVAGRQTCFSAGAKGAGIGIELAVPSPLVVHHSDLHLLQFFAGAAKTHKPGDRNTSLPPVASFTATYLSQKWWFFYYF